MNQSATVSIDSSADASSSKLVAMVVVMFVGMGVLAGLGQLALGAAGSSARSPTAFGIIPIGLGMTAPMVAWMAYRGHPCTRNAEMAASMVIPTLIAAVLAWPGALDTGATFAVQHTAMIQAMRALMLWHYDEYAYSCA